MRLEVAIGTARVLDFVVLDRSLLGSLISMVV